MAQQETNRAMALCNFHSGNDLFCMQPAEFDNCQMLYGDFEFGRSKKVQWTQSLSQKNMNVPAYSLLHWIASTAGLGHLNVAWAQIGIRYHSGTEATNVIHFMCAACNRATEEYYATNESSPVKIMQIFWPWAEETFPQWRGDRLAQEELARFRRLLAPWNRIEELERLFAHSGSLPLEPSSLGLAASQVTRGHREHFERHADTFNCHFCNTARQRPVLTARRVEVVEEED